MNTYETLDKVKQDVAILEAKLAQTEKLVIEGGRENARLRDQLRDVFGAVYIRLDGSVKPGTVYADASDGPMREVREAYLQPVPPLVKWAGLDEPVPSRTRRFRLMGQVGKLYVYGEV